MNYPKAKESNEPFVFDNKRLDDPYQWMRDGKNNELLQWVAKENTLTDNFFSKHQKVYQKYLKRNRERKSFPAYSHITKSPHGYVMTKQILDSYKIIETDFQFNEKRSFETLLSTIENTTFFSGAICPNDENIAVFHGLCDGYDRPSLFVFDLEKKQLLYRADGIFSYVFEESGKCLLYGDAQADVANKTTHTYLKRYDIEKGEEECLFAYPENAIMIEGYSSNEKKEAVAVVMRDYSNNLIYFQTEKGMQPYSMQAQVINYCGKVAKGHILCSFIHSEYGQIIVYDPQEKTEEVIFEQEGIYIKEAVVINENIYVLAAKDVSSVAYVISNDKISEISLPEECNVSVAGQSKEDGKVFVMIESFNLIPQLYALKDDTCKPVFKENNPADPMIQIDKVFYPSKDQTMIPAYLVYRKDAVKNGKMPTLMYGYGGYNLAMPPSYHNPFCGIDVVDWVNDGGLYVQCCIRGGNEYGEKWHIDGYRMKKKNCFYDFIGIAEGIIRDGWTSKKHIAINGGSNGGLLMCALLTMRPDLWGCVVASVPHTDMISFVFDDRGPMYITEYGDPHDEEQFNYFLTYSPFHNIQKTAYPAVYIQTGECDNNVPPYHGKKMAARLQQYNTSDQPILLRVLAKGSHDRGKGETYLKTVSEMQAFIEIAIGQND